MWLMIEDALGRLPVETFRLDATPSSLIAAIKVQLPHGDNARGEQTGVQAQPAEPDPLSFAQTLRHLKEDMRTYRHRYARSALSIMLTVPSFQALFVFRVSHWLSRFIRRRSPLVFPIVVLDLLMRRVMEIVSNIYISPHARIGPGLFLPHFGGIVIGSGVVIGAHCEIFHNVTLGRRTPRGTGCPCLGDRVYLGPGAMLFGGIVVGDDAYVSANSVLAHSVPDRACVVGNPSRVTSHNGSFEHIDYPGMEADLGRLHSLALRNAQIRAASPKVG
jgi:serine O-acetyltransferase